MDETAIRILIIGGGILNLLFSGGALYKLIDFASDYGATKNTVHTLKDESANLRQHYHDVATPAINQLSVRVAKLEGAQDKDKL